MKKPRQEFKISINDGFYEFTYIILVPYYSSIASVFEKIRKSFRSIPCKGLHRKGGKIP